MSPDENQAQQRRSRFLRTESDEDESDEEATRVVKSAKDKRLEEMEACGKTMDNALKINDWVAISNGAFGPHYTYMQLFMSSRVRQAGPHGTAPTERFGARPTVLYPAIGQLGGRDEHGGGEGERGEEEDECRQRTWAQRHEAKSQKGDEGIRDGGQALSGGQSIQRHRISCTDFRRNILRNIF